MFRYTHKLEPSRADCISLLGSVHWPASIGKILYPLTAFDGYRKSLPMPRLRNNRPTSPEVFAMDIEDRLKKLQSSFSYALSGAVAAKAHYLALMGEGSSTPAAVARAKMAWQQLEARKTAIIARMVALEELEETAA
jgi:hypothetical protein